MAEELTIDSLEKMKSSDFIKALKNKSAWKKATAIIVMVDYKLSDGKKMTVAIPLKKEADMKTEMYKIKSQKLHSTKKTGGGSFSVAKEGKDGDVAKIELKRGGLSPEILQVETKKLFSFLNMTLEDISIAADAEMEIPKTSQERFDNMEKRDRLLSKTINDIEALEKSLSSFTPSSALELIEKYLAILDGIGEEAVNEQGYSAPILKLNNETYSNLEALKIKAAALPAEPDGAVAVELTTKMKKVLEKIQALPAENPDSEATKKNLMAELNGYYTALNVLQKSNAAALKNLPNDLKKVALDSQKLLTQPTETETAVAVELTTNLKSVLEKIQALPPQDPKSEPTKKALMAELTGHYNKLCIYQKNNANALKNLPNDLKKAAMDSQKLIHEAKNAQ